MRVSRRNKSFAFAGAAGLLLAVAGPAAAEPVTIEINPPRGVVVDGVEGEEFGLPSVAVAPEHQGQECSIIVFAENGESLHEGNHLIIRSNGNLATVEGIEEEPNLLVELDATMVVDDTIELGLVFGPDGQSSLDLSVDLDCAEQEGDSGSSSDSSTTSTTAVTTSTTVALVESAPIISTADAIAATTTTTTVPDSGFLSETNSLIPGDSALAEAPPLLPSGAGLGEVVLEATPAQAVAGSPAYTG